MKDFLWVEKYRPKNVNDCILPENTINVFKGFVDQGEIPNLLLTGTAGVGKTTIAKALCEEIGASYIIINGSDEGRFLDTVRNRVRQFATTVVLYLPVILSIRLLNHYILDAQLLILELNLTNHRSYKQHSFKD